MTCGFRPLRRPSLQNSAHNFLSFLFVLFLFFYQIVRTRRCEFILCWRRFDVCARGRDAESIRFLLAVGSKNDYFYNAIDGNEMYTPRYAFGTYAVIFVEQTFTKRLRWKSDHVFSRTRTRRVPESGGVAGFHDPRPRGDLVEIMRRRKIGLQPHVPGRRSRCRAWKEWGKHDVYTRPENVRRKDSDVRFFFYRSNAGTDFF